MTCFKNIHLNVSNSLKNKLVGTVQRHGTLYNVAVRTVEILFIKNSSAYYSSIAYTDYAMYNVRIV